VSRIDVKISFENRGKTFWICKARRSFALNNIVFSGNLLVLGATFPFLLLSNDQYGGC
jgi:hypothetical protein